MPLQEITKKLNQKGWTPGRKEVLNLLAALPNLDEDTCKKACAAIGTIDSQAFQKIRLAWSTLPLLVKQISARYVGIAAFKNQNDVDEHQALAWFVEAITFETDVRVLKGFFQASSHGLDSNSFMARQTVVDAIVAAAKDKKLDFSAAKALALALGKSMDVRARELISSLNVQYELNDRKSELILSRDLARDHELASTSKVGLTFESLQQAVIDGPLTKYVFKFVPGLELLARRSSEFSGSSRLKDGLLSVDLKELNPAIQQKIPRNRMWQTFAVVLKVFEQKDKPSQQDLVSLLAEHQEILFKSLITSEPLDKIRVRVDRSSGFSKNDVWDFASLLSKNSTKILCDGREAHWDLQIIQGDGQAWYVCMEPQKFEDDRWSWRQGVVDGSSQGTLAHAIARLAGVRSGDAVWDPFCGAGTELFEVALSLESKASLKLFGSDISSESLDNLQQIAQRLGISVETQCGSALDVQRRFDVVITNPPFGMRTARGQARGLLEQFFMHMRTRLTANGRFVLLSHAPSATVEWGQRAGLRLSESIPILLDGMSCELQKFE